MQFRKLFRSLEYQRKNLPLSQVLDAPHDSRIIWIHMDSMEFTDGQPLLPPELKLQILICRFGKLPETEMHWQLAEIILFMLSDVTLILILYFSITRYTG